MVVNMGENWFRCSEGTISLLEFFGSEEKIHLAVVLRNKSHKGQKLSPRDIINQVNLSIPLGLRIINEGQKLGMLEKDDIGNITVSKECKWVLRKLEDLGRQLDPELVYSFSSEQLESNEVKKIMKDLENGIEEIDNGSLNPFILEKIAEIIQLLQNSRYANLILNFVKRDEIEVKEFKEQENYDSSKSVSNLLNRKNKIAPMLVKKNNKMEVTKISKLLAEFLDELNHDIVPHLKMRLDLEKLKKLIKSLEEKKMSPLYLEDTKMKANFEILIEETKKRIRKVEENERRARLTSKTDNNS